MTKTDWMFSREARQADADYRLLRDFGLYRCEHCGKVEPVEMAGMLAAMPPSMNDGGHADVCRECAL